MAAGKYTLSKKFVGYGHYEISIKDKSGNVKSVISNNTDLIERLSSELPEEKDKATEEAIAYILSLQ